METIRTNERDPTKKRKFDNVIRQIKRKCPSEALHASANVYENTVYHIEPEYNDVSSKLPDITAVSPGSLQKLETENSRKYEELQVEEEDVNYEVLTEIENTTDSQDRDKPNDNKCACGKRCLIPHWFIQIPCWAKTLLALIIGATVIIVIISIVLFTGK